MKIKDFKLYPLLVTVMITAQLICFIYARRQIDLNDNPVNLSGIIFPLDLYLVEIIGECYGYEYSRQAVWLNIISHLIYICLTLLFSCIKYPDFMHTNLVYSYQNLIDISWVVALGSLIGTFLGDMFSAKYVPKLKFILKGRYIFLRIFVCQIFSEIIVTSSYLISFLSNGYELKSTLIVIFNTIISKTIVALILYPFIKLIINVIKKSENMEVFDYKQDYHTMAFIINQEKIMIKDIKIKND